MHAMFHPVDDFEFAKMTMRHNYTEVAVRCASRRVSLSAGGATQATGPTILADYLCYSATSLQSVGDALRTGTA